MLDDLLGTLRDRILSTTPGSGEASTSGDVTGPSACRTEPGSVALGELADEQKLALAALKEAAAVGENHRPPVPEFPGWEPDRPPLELDLMRVPETRWLGADLEALARELVGSVVEGASRKRLATLKAGALSAVEEAAEVAGLGPREFLERAREERDPGSAPEEMDALLQEAAVEEHGVLLRVEPGNDEGGDPGELPDVRFRWEPAGERRLELVRTARLFDRLEASLLGEPYLTIQRRISRWWFARWSLEQTGEGWERSRDTRQREWTLLDRTIPGLDGPVLDVYLERDTASSLPDGQASLARRLGESVVSAFEVLERRGERTVLEDVRTGRHREGLGGPGEGGCEPGALAVGRLWPAADEGLWVRSTGISYTDPDRRGEARELAEGVLEAPPEESSDRAIANEILIRALLTDEPPPRDLKPALSRKLAREMLERTVGALKGAALARPVTDAEAEESEVARKLAGAGEILLESRVDEPTAAWLAALDRQARGLR